MVNTDNNNSIIRNWLYFNAFMVFCMAVIGAITRLTESGLSMVEWRPLIGAIPPLSEAEWTRVFELYRQTPEYNDVNYGMPLDEFKTIFFWEWFHRLWGRLISLTYTLPLIFFWIKGMIPQGMKKTLLGLLFLGGAQAVMGWVMVLSGLVDQPSVSHYRLAAHLSLAFVIFGCLLLTAFSMHNIKPKPTTFCLRRHGYIALAFVSITVIWGAFMAGMDAGLVSNTWPHMYDGVYLPNIVLDMDILGMATDEVGIHFTHRWLAFLTLIIVATFAWRIKSSWLAMMIGFQFIWGIITITSFVHVHIAAMHQAGAFAVVGILLYELYAIRKEA